MSNIKEYMEVIRNSERLKTTLKLFKSGNITIDEAIAFIDSDVQFHKEERLQWTGLSGTMYTTFPSITTTTDTTNPYIISRPGRAIVVYGVTSTDLYDPYLNTGLDSTECQIALRCRFDDNSPLEQGIMLKHSRGFIGTFGKIVLQWPAQTGIKARLVVHNWDAMPWQTGDGS